MIGIGGLGHMGVQILRAVSAARLVAADINEAKLEFARNAFDAVDVNFALEVHLTEIAFDIASAERALEAVKYHKRFGFNSDPSHLAYQGVEYVKFIRTFKDRIYHVHMKDVWWGMATVMLGCLADIPISATIADSGIFGLSAVEISALRKSLWRSTRSDTEDRCQSNGRMLVWTESKGQASHVGNVRSYDFAPSATAFERET